MRVEPQVFDVLVHLLAHRDRVVPKVELLESMWGDRFVSESAPTSRIKAARRALGDDGMAQRTIRTVHGRGYQFVAPVTAVEAAGPKVPRPAGRLSQQIRFCVSGAGVRIAYACTGGGPPLVARRTSRTDPTILGKSWRSDGDPAPRWLSRSRGLAAG